MLTDLPEFTGAHTLTQGTAGLVRKTETDPWTLISLSVDGGLHTTLGKCICHWSLDCPTGSQNRTARRILRGDHPEALRAGPIPTA